MGLFSKLSDSLSKTRKGFVEKLFDSFTGKEIDDDLYDELEELLIQGDVGVNTAVDLVERLREREKRDKLKYAEQLKDALVEEIAEIMGDEVASFDLDKDNLNIILVVGVNGVGKTTSIGKIANLLKSEGHKVILGAGDTFRAAAAEQLKVWGDRVGCDVISHQEGADPAAVVFDAIAAAKSRKCNVLIVDTAGRLQNKSNLMNELSKMRKVIDREAPGCLKEVLLVLDATTGQNAISQAKIFGDATGVTGVVLTKLDGTAKGAVVIGILSEFDLPVKLIGTGEAIDNMEYFDAKAFGKALFSDEESLKDKAEEIIEDIKEEVAEKVEELKEEVAELKQDAAEFKANAKVEMAELKQEVKAEAANLKANVKEEVQELKEDVEEFIADVQDDIADLMDAPQADDLEDAEETVEEKPRKKGFFSGLFGGRK